MRHFKTLDFLLISVCCAIILGMGLIVNNTLFILIGSVLFTLATLDNVRLTVKDRKKEKENGNNVECDS